MLDARQFSDFEKLRRESVERCIWIPEDAPSDIARVKSGYSFYRFLLDEITKSAKQEAINRNATEDDFAYSLLPEATGIVDDIRSALVERPYYDLAANANDLKSSWNFWKHVKNPRYEIQKKNVPYIDRSSLETAAARYLESPFRCVPVDRLLVDALTAAEVFAFGNEMLNPYFRWISPLTQRHPLWAYIKGQFTNLVVFGGIIAFAGWLYSRDIIGSTAFGWIAGILFSLIVLFFALATIFLPMMWWRQAKAKRKIAALLDDMIGVYAELQSDGAISAEHVRARAQWAAERGVKWPATLFALLDDIIRRTGRF